MRERGGVRSNRFWPVSALAAAALAASASRSDAQVIPTVEEPLMPPWNAQDVFKPTPWPDLSDPDTREPVAPEDTPVKNRFRPEYQPRGIRAGSWLFNPTLSAGTFYDSNVFSSDANRQSDVAAVLDAGLRAHTLWERHGIDVQALTQSTLYKDHSGLNQTDATLKGTGRFDIDHATMLLTGFKAAYLHEGVGTLSSPLGAVEPTPYSLFSGDVTLRKEFGRVTGSVGIAADSYDFGSTRARDGTIIDQSARDGQVYTAHGRIDYAFSPKMALFTAVEGNARRLRGMADTSLSSDGYRALAGVDFEVTRLVKAELAGGYMSQRFDAASIGTIEGPAYRARLTWSPSRRLDVHFNAEQVVSEASDTSATGILANALQLGFDYEFRPNIVLSTAGTFEQDSFKGQDRADDVYAVDARLKYLLNNVNSISLWYRYTQRDSSVPDFSFTKHQVGINASARF
jgi:hypothetical protein